MEVWKRGKSYVEARVEYFNKVHENCKGVLAKKKEDFARQTWGLMASGFGS